jgi:hypothetical protein
MSAALTTDELERLDASRLCDSEIRETYIALRRDNDRREAVAARLLIALHRRGVPKGEGASATTMWVQFQTGQRSRDTRVSLNTGKVCEALPLVAKAWAQGEIPANAAATIAHRRRAGHDDIYQTMEESMVAFAAERDFEALDLMIRRYHTHCNDLDDKPPEDKNDLYLSRVGNRWALKADLDALSGAILKQAIDAATDKPDPDDPRTLAQRKAAAAVRLGRSFLDRGESPTQDGERPHIAITVPVEALRSGTFETTGDLALTHSQISDLLCDSKLQIIVLGDDGKPLDVGAAIYPLPQTPKGSAAPRPWPLPISRLRPHPRPHAPRHPLPKRQDRPRQPRVLVRLPPPRPAQTRLAHNLRRHHHHRHQPRRPNHRQQLNGIAGTGDRRRRARGRSRPSSSLGLPT